MKPFTWILWGLVCGWPNDGYQPGPKADLARIIIYRQREFGGNPYQIVINGTKIGTLSTNRYFVVEVPAGRVKVESTWWNRTDRQTLWLTLQPGQTQYVKAVEELDFLSRRLLLAPVREEKAQAEMKKIKPDTPRENVNE